MEITLAGSPRNPGAGPGPYNGRMKVTVKFFASLRERVGQDRAEVEVGDASRVRDVWRAVADWEPDARVLAAVNARHAPLDAAVADGDEVAFFPPVTGG